MNLLKTISPQTKTSKNLPHFKIDYREILLLFILSTFGIYLFYTNLSGAMIGIGDEGKSFYNLFLATPGLFLIARPFVNFFNTFDAVYYLNGTFGFINVFLIYGIVRNTFSKRLAISSAFSYMCLDFALAHAKILFYSTAVIFTVLFSVYLFTLALKRNSPIFVYFSGAFIGICAVMTPSTYAPIIGTVCWIAYLHINSLGGKLRLSLFGVAWRFILGASLTFLCFDFFYYQKFSDGVSYIFHSFYHKGQSSRATYRQTMGFQGITYLISSIFKSQLASPERMFRHIVCLACFVGAMVLSIQKKNRAVIGSFIFGFVSLSIFCTSTYLGLHTIGPRHLVWLSIPMSISIAYCFNNLWNVGQHAWKIGIKSFILFFVLISSIHAVNITQSLLSRDVIYDFLEKNNIQRSKVITTFFAFTRREDFRTGDFIRSAPTFELRPRFGNRVFLDWPKVIHGYRMGRYTHYITSDLDNKHILPQKYDPILNQVEPLAVWEHPKNNAYLFLNPRNITIEIYSIESLNSVYLEYVKNDESFGKVPLREITAVHPKIY